MKYIFIFINLFFYLISYAQVTVTLQSKYLKSMVNLDSIMVENLTQPNQMTLAAPPGITSYDIDLMKGKIINYIPENNTMPCINENINMLGCLQLCVVLERSETFKVTLFNKIGQIKEQWTVECGQGMSLLNISAGIDQMFICVVEGKNFKNSFKIIGNSNGRIGFSLVQGIEMDNANIQKIKSVSGFVYAPGDDLRFTAIRNGMYRNSISTIPQNLDTILIYLSLPCPGTSTVNDFDGNKYNTVLIGDQCWMRENLKSKYYADGTPLVNGTGVGDITFDYTTKYWFDYDDNPTNSEIYGRLYTGAAMMNGTFGSTGNIQGICPVGWHVSSSVEWCKMEKLLDSTITDCSYNPHDPYGTTIGNQLKETDTVHWQPINNIANDESGFNGLPGGNRGSFQFGGLRSFGIWWAWDPSVGIAPGQQQMRELAWNNSMIFREMFISSAGFSVRCIKDQ
jgi:uncharacterized protein (TIGR02145 family)